MEHLHEHVVDHLESLVCSLEAQIRKEVQEDVCQLHEKIQELEVELWAVRRKLEEMNEPQECVLL